MKLIRWLLGKIILWIDAIFSPNPVARTSEEQERVNAAVKHISIYQFEACPFCVKVRRFLRAQSIPISLKNAQMEPFRSELLAGGGKLQVPCLRIEKEGKVEWLYESSDIIAYVKNLVGMKEHVL